MGGSDGGGGGGDTRTEIRYNPTVEDAYVRLILGNADANHEIPQHGLWYTMWRTYAHHENLYSDTPYTHYEKVSVTDGFWGGGQGVLNYAPIGAYIQTYLQGQSPQLLWSETYANTVAGAEIAASVTAHNQLLDVETQAYLLPRYLAGMRDINAVQASTFVLGRELIVEYQQRLVSDFQAKIRLAAVDLSAKLWARRLDWYKDIVLVFKDTMLAYYQDRLEYDRIELEYQVKDRLWNLTLFDDLRATVGALNGAAASGGSAGRANVPSQGMKSLAAGISGAAAGAQVGASLGASGGGVYGAIAGAAIGVGLSFL